MVYSMNSKLSIELSERLIESVQAGMPVIQHNFDAYQNACFPVRSPEFFCLELCGEAGELANLEKKRWKGKSIADERIADEAADVFIALCNYANARGINLAEAVGLKLAAIEKKRSRLEGEGEMY